MRGTWLCTYLRTPTKCSQPALTQPPTMNAPRQNKIGSATHSGRSHPRMRPNATTTVFFHHYASALPHGVFGVHFRLPPPLPPPFGERSQETQTRENKYLVQNHRLLSRCFRPFLYSSVHTPRASEREKVGWHRTLEITSPPPRLVLCIYSASFARHHILVP